ncbi:hypothetical protein [Fimbriiglobus ruber]|uniref:SMI1/KNR4 family protein n=1 Tax=Fimbriiglobus ruber TaxID=1908690 RepID=A0A225DWE8_9BACT|nr:hypothetical protein [Fimbriiglobus ruber]OWK45373.1 hypothetical protein FRUB_01704 [Fimbriiglobus ruber]
MTEAEWLAATDPTPMLESLLGKLSDRKLRLFSAVCCRSLGRHVLDKRTAQLAGTLERYADESRQRERVLSKFLRTLDEIRAEQESLYPLPPGLPGWMTMARRIERAALLEAIVLACDPDDPQTAAMGVSLIAERSSHPGSVRNNQAAFARDIFGLFAFRPIAVDPSWLTSTAVALATSIYADRAFDRLPILADALQDAGCDSDDILAHCRGDEPHVRGCWVVDLLLGKK